MKIWLNFSLGTIVIGCAGVDMIRIFFLRGERLRLSISGNWEERPEDWSYIPYQLMIREKIQRENFGLDWVEDGCIGFTLQL